MWKTSRARWTGSKGVPDAVGGPRNRRRPLYKRRGVALPSAYTVGPSLKGLGAWVWHSMPTGAGGFRREKGAHPKPLGVLKRAAPIK